MNTNIGSDIKWGSCEHKISVSSDGKTAYVSNFGIKDYDSGAGLPGASISVIDIPSRIEKYRLYTFSPSSHLDYANIDSAPHGVKLRPFAEDLLYVNMEKGAKLLVFNTKTRQIIKKFNVSANTHNIFFSPDGKDLWLMAGKDGVIRMDPDTGDIKGTYLTSTPVRGLKYTPDNRYLMVSSVNQIDFVDPQSLTVQKQFKNLGVGAVLYSDITPDQRYIIAPAAFDNQVIVIEVSTGKIVKRLVTGLNPVTVMIDTEGDYAYITNATDHHVTKLDLKTFETTKLLTKDGPNGITLVPFSEKIAHQKLVLGVALPLSGQDSARGRDMMRGYKYWRLQVTDAGGLLINDKAYDVSIVYLDTQSDMGNVGALTRDLIDNYHVNLLLSTYGSVAWNAEKTIALEKQIPITPAQTNEDPWLPNDVAAGHDYFVTTHLYDQKYATQYNFKASTYSASATTIGLILQNAITEAQSLNDDDLTKILNNPNFDLFSKY